MYIGNNGAPMRSVTNNDSLLAIRLSRTSILEFFFLKLEWKKKMWHPFKASEYCVCCCPNSVRRIKALLMMHNKNIRKTPIARIE